MTSIAIRQIFPDLSTSLLPRTLWGSARIRDALEETRAPQYFAGRNAINDGASVWVASMGHLMGMLDSNWLSIRSTRKIAMLRYAAFHKVENGRITQEAMYFGIPHLMQQAGQNPFGPQTGAALVQPGPMTHGGLLFEDADPEEGEKTLCATYTIERFAEQHFGRFRMAFRKRKFNGHVAKIAEGHFGATLIGQT